MVCIFYNNNKQQMKEGNNQINQLKTTNKIPVKL